MFPRWKPVECRHLTGTRRVFLRPFGVRFDIRLGAGTVAPRTHPLQRRGFLLVPRQLAARVRHRAVPAEVFVNQHLMVVRLRDRLGRREFRSKGSWQLAGVGVYKCILLQYITP